MLQQWAWTLCDEFCTPLNVEMQPGIHQPNRFDRNYFDERSLMSMMNKLQVRNVPQATPETDGVLSITGVSTHNILKICYCRHLYTGTLYILV